MFRLLFLGIAGTGREEVLARLIRGSLTSDEEVTLFLPESLSPVDWLSERCQVRRWRLESGSGGLSLDPQEKESDWLILVGDGGLSPVPLLESMAAPGPETSPFWPNRVVTLVDAGVASREPAVSEWYDGAAHFSDLVLVQGLGAETDAWVQQFEGRLQRNCWPCLVDRVRKGQPKHPDWAFDPVPRRLSQLFEEKADLLADEEDGEEERVEDPFIERNPAGGYRRPFPDLSSLVTADQW